MSKRGRDEMDIDESLGPRSAKRKALEILSEDKAKKDVAAQKREVNKKLRGEVDDLAGLFGKMKSSDEEEDVMQGQGRRRRRRHTRKQKKSKKSKKTRKH
jgi:hypothetical protein